MNKPTLRVQEYIARSGRYHLFQPSFDNIRDALISMRVKVKFARATYRQYNTKDDSFVEKAHLETDNKTYIDVVSDGGARRRFTIVAKRGGEPIPFDHLLRRDR